MNNKDKNNKLLEVAGIKPTYILRCLKCDTCYENPKNITNVFCSECKEKGYAVVGVCHSEIDPAYEEINLYVDDKECRELVEKLIPTSKFDEWSQNLITLILRSYKMKYGCDYGKSPVALFGDCALASNAQLIEATGVTLELWEREVDEYRYCMLPSGNAPEFGEIDEELKRRKISYAYYENGSGGRLYRIHENELHKLPTDESGVYLGDNDSGHSLYALNCEEIESYAAGSGAVTWINA